MLNGWWIEYGSQCKPPTLLPEHEKIMDLVKKRAAERIEQLEEIKAQEEEGARSKDVKKASQPSSSRQNRKKGSKFSETNRLLNEHESWKMRKAERRKVSGNQSSPSHTAPKISPIGNLRITRR